MIFDPAKRKAKYSALQEAIVGSGFYAEVMVRETEPDAIAIFANPDASDLAQPQERFLMFCRQRGWFLGVSGLRRYRITDQSAVANIVLDLVSMLRDLQREEALARVLQKYMIAPVEQQTWHLEEGEEQRLSWEQYGWRTLSHEEETRVWDEFGSHFLDRSGKIRIMKPALSWAIPNQVMDDPEASGRIEKKLTIAVLDALRQSTLAAEYVLALDWDHPCYLFFPHQCVRESYRDYWAVPVWPQSDSYYFVAPNFEFGILASRSGEFHVFGQTFIDVCDGAITDLLGQPLDRTKGSESLP